MAETKTNIPVEIKMGNAGAEGANLPAFKEGSIIFTKDTKKIYIDPPGESERIAVGGGEVDLSGKQDKFCVVTNTLLGSKNALSLDNFGYYDKNTNAYKTLSATDSFYINPKVNTITLLLSNGAPLTLTDDKDGNIKISGVSNGTATQDAVNKGQLDAKQDKFATVTTADTVQTVKIGDTLSIITTPNLNADLIKSTGVLELSGNETTNSYVSLRKTKLGSNCDFDAKQGYLRVRDDPLADDFAVNKKYVDNNSGAGKKFGTSEVFNDYENNVVWNEKYDGGLLVTDLSDTVVTLENVEGLAVGGTFNIYSLTHDYTSGNLTITAINTSTNKVTFSPEYAGPPLTVATLYVVNSTATKTTKLFYEYAHAEGYQTKAINNYSHAEGIGTIAGHGTGVPSEGIAQTAVGMYNTVNPYLFFIVGNGTAANARSNAFEVYKDGHATVQKMGTTDNSVVIKSELDKKQNDLKITLDSSNHNIQLSSSYNTFLLNKGTLGSVGNINFSPSGNQQINYCKYICNEAVGQSGSTMITLGDGKVSFTNYAGNETIRLTNVATPVDNTDAVNKKYVDDIKAELLEAITHPYTYDETTKELTLIL